MDARKPRELNYRQGLMAALIFLVFFAGEAIAHVEGWAGIIGSGVVVGGGVAGGLLLLRSASASRTS